MGHRYAFVFTGFVDLGQPVGITTNAGGGWELFHANGTLSTSASLSIGGLIIPSKDKGKYELHLDTTAKPPSCIGTATMQSGSTFQFVVSADGSQIEQMHTDQGLVVLMDVARMENRTCSNATLKTNYLYVASGYFAPQGYPLAFGEYTPFGFSGIITFDGQGNLVGWDTVSIAGNAVPRTYKGTYTVKADCTATMELKDTLNNDIHTKNFIYAGARKIAFINTDAGTVLGFNATRQ